MPRYQYKALDSLGRMIHGETEAHNEFDLDQRLEKMSLSLVNYELYKPKRFFSLRRKRYSRRELINFTIQLEQMVCAGVPIVQSLCDLRDSEANVFFRDVLNTIVETIEAGSTFAQALEAHMDIFGKVYVFMARVGEQSGQLGTVLRELAQMLKWQDELMARAKSVTVYPSLVFVLVIGVVAFLMSYLVPLLIPFLENNGFAIPFYTQALMAVSNFIAGYWFWLLLGAVSLCLLAYLLNRYNGKFHYWFDRQRLNFWLLGPIILKVKLSRFAKHLALMYGSGVTVLDGLELSRPVMDNVVLDESLMRAKQLIENGSSISDGFAQVGLFPPLVIRMLQVGETSGNLDKSLLNVSYFYERDARESIDRIEPVVMPVLTVVLGGLILWIMASVLFPLYEALGTITA